MDPIVKNDLLAVIGLEELDGLAAELLEDGQPDPIETAIAEGLDWIALYVDPLIVPDGARKRIWRLLSVCWIYNRLGRLSEKRKEEQDDMIKVLTDIRDGKFKNLEVDEDLDNSGDQAAFGSNTKISPR